MKTATINTKQYKRETAIQEYIAGDGSKQYRELEKYNSYTEICKTVKVIDGGKDLGFGYMDNNMFVFAGIVDRNISSCQKFAERMNLDKWDKDLN